jgi:hypothetical protein
MIKNEFKNKNVICRIIMNKDTIIATHFKTTLVSFLEEMNDVNDPRFILLKGLLTHTCSHIYVVENYIKKVHLKYKDLIKLRKAKDMLGEEFWVSFHPLVGELMRHKSYDSLSPEEVGILYEWLDVLSKLSEKYILCIK